MTDSSKPTMASLSLNFVVVGAGVGGLSAAYTLCKAGHNVRVLERLPGLQTPAAGLKVPPNMSKILKRWVGEEELNKTAVLNTCSPWWDIHTGERMGAAAWRRAVMTETGGDYLMMAHEDVLCLIHRIAVEAGANIEFGVNVIEVTPGNPNPSITLANGEVITADMIIGADGHRSLVRDVVLGKKDAPRPDGHTVFHGVVPESYMLSDPELCTWVKSSDWTVGLGDNRSFCTNPIRAYTGLSLTIHWPDEESGNSEETWLDVVPTETINNECLSPIFQRLLKGAPNLIRTRSMERDDIEHWFHECERIVILGEAAHSWLPGLTHSSAMAVEDAVVLGTLFSHLSAENQISLFLKAYEEIRQERVIKVRARDASNALSCRLPPGPEQDALYADLRKVRDEWDDGILKSEFEGLSDLFGYDAYDAAEEWWVKWGRYGARNSRDLYHPISDVQFAFASMSVEQHENAAE